MRTNAFNLIEKLRKLYIEDEDSQRFLDDKENKLRQALETAKIRDIPAIKLLIADTEKRIVEINTLLILDDKLTDIQRAGLFHERDAHEFHLDRISAKRAEETVKSIENYVTDALAKAEKRNLSTDV